MRKRAPGASLARRSWKRGVRRASRRVRKRALSAWRDASSTSRVGAAVVLGHGETIVEPVLPGTNRAAIEAKVDVLAHPGLISEQDARLAAERGVFLEISGRKGHSFTNGHVAQISRRVGARLVFGSDSHAPGDLLPRAQAERIAAGAGLSPDEIAALFQNAEELLGSIVD